MTELPINQKEYLKKYLGIGKAPGEKKKKKKKTIKRVEIIDDDIEVNTVTTINEKDVVVIDEDAPQIVAIIDERPPSMRIDEKTKNPLWQPIGTVTNSEQSEQKQMIKSFKLEPKTNDKLISLSDKSPPRRKKRADVDQSPPRVPRTLSPSRDIVIKEERRSVARTEDNSPPRRSGDDDYSPPRRRKRQGDDISPPRKNRRKDEDISSPRKNRQKDDDMTPPRRSRDSTVDKSRSHATISLSHKSPPRRKTLSPLRDIVIKEERRSVPRSEDNFPPRRSGDDDISPPRKNRRKDDDISPPRKNRRKDDDMTPPRRSRDSTVDKNRFHATSNDNSPPRRESRKDLSPPRRSRSAVNRTHTPSPPRRRKDVDGDKSRSKHDDSPPRRSKDARNLPRRKEEGKSGRNRTPDQSPPRRIKREDRSKTEERNEKSTSETKRTKKMEKTLDGKSAGLQNARELVEETNNFRSREDNLFKSLSKEVSGENATTVHRERQTGRIRNFEEELERQRKKHEEEQKNKEKYERWGRGLAQVESREQQLKEQLHEMSKPLARYADDEDLEKFLKEQEREGDPMLAYLRKKKKKKAAERGEVTKPEFQGEFMPNRYGIKPGHRWDGVDRSNGYEKKWFEVQNQKKAIQEDVYKWSTEDM